MSKIEQIILRCADLDAQRRFYKEVLGMMEFADGSVGYGGEQASLLFQKSEGDYAPASNVLYWKISLAVPNIELAYQQLIEQGIQVGVPQQFSDIAYLAHFTDLEGFSIELINHWFKGNHPDETINSDLFGGGAHLNLLTLRYSTGIEEVTQSCLDSGMKMLSIMPVESHGFTLYFLAYTLDTLPSSDVYSIENREWVFQRKYTVLEIQHLHNQVGILKVNDQQAGYVGTIISAADCDVDELLMAKRF